MHEDASQPQNDLFVPSVSDAPSETESAVLAACDSWDAAALAQEAALNGYRQLLDDVQALEARHQREHRGNSGTLDLDVKALLDERCTAILDDLIARASKRFSAYGATLEIDATEATLLFLPSTGRHAHLSRGEIERRRRMFSPVALANYLKAKYQSSGAALSLQEAATRLVAWLPFGRRFNAATRTDNASTTFSIYVANEDPYSGRKEQYQLSYDERFDRQNSVRHGARDLVVFLAWANGEPDLRPGDRADLSELNAWLDRDGAYDSRFKIAVGPVVLQFFKNKLDIKFSARVAERLNLFLTEFAGDALASAIARR